METSRRSLAVMLLSVACIAGVTFGLSALAVGPPAFVADGLCYNAAAARLLNTGIYSYLPLDVNSIEPPNAFITPGYILLLSFIYLFLPHAGDPYAVIAGAIPSVTFMHFISAVATAILISATGYKIAGRRLGWIAGIVAALYLPFGAEAMSGWSENIGLLLTTACLFLAIGLFESVDANASKWMVAFGVCGGAAIMVRPVISLWLLVPICFWGWKNRSNLRRAITVMIIGCLSIAIVMAPWVIRNAVTFGKFIPLTTHAGTVWIDGVGGIALGPAEKTVFAEAARRGQDGYQVVAFDRLRAKWTANPTAFVIWKVEQSGSMLQRPWSSQENPFNPLPEDAPKVTGDNYRLMDKSVYQAWMFLIGAIHWLALGLAVAAVIVLRRRAVIWLVASVRSTRSLYAASSVRDPATSTPRCRQSCCSPACS